MRIDVTSDKMPEELKIKLEKLTPFTRKYAEYRAKGLKQADAAQKAGSKAATRSSLTRVGYNTEQFDGVKEYILWLEHKRAKACVIDDVELINKARDTYEAAMDRDKYGDAVKALDILCKIAGIYDQVSNDAVKNQGNGDKKSKNNTEAFKEDVEHESPEERLKRLQSMLKKV